MVSYLLAPDIFRHNFKHIFLASQGHLFFPSQSPPGIKSNSAEVKYELMLDIVQEEKQIKGDIYVGSLPKGSFVGGVEGSNDRETVCFQFTSESIWQCFFSVEAVGAKLYRPLQFRGDILPDGTLKGMYAITDGSPYPDVSHDDWKPYPGYIGYRGLRRAYPWEVVLHANKTPL